MDLGVITLIIAIIFTGIGIAAGILISKILSGKSPQQPDLTGLKERIEGLADRASSTVDRINEKLKGLEAEKIDELRKDVEELISEVNRLKRELHHVDVSQSSINALEKTGYLLEQIEFNLPRVDNSLLTQIKDNLLILRNDLENILSRTRETKPQTGIDPSLLDSLLSSVNAALEVSKKLNASLVKGELTALANSFKNEELTSLVKELDNQSLNSKEVVVLLEEVKKKLEGVRDESSIRG